ncbi:MAG: hypothetical protein PHV43_01415 [Candidatus Colwellbacteria bacterium]|nr:hypothetical protein [Candidatus Colwellbacteria bacterium]
MNRKEEKNRKFRELAEKRVTRVLEDLRILSNLSNTSLYSYSDTEVHKIFSAIDGATRVSKAAFQRGQREKKREFKL